MFSIVLENLNKCFSSIRQDITFYATRTLMSVVENRQLHPIVLSVPCLCFLVSLTRTIHCSGKHFFVFIRNRTRFFHYYVCGTEEIFLQIFLNLYFMVSGRHT